MEQSEYSAKVRQSQLLTHKRQVHRFYKIPSQDWGASQCQCMPSSLRQRCLHIRTAKYLVIISVHRTSPTHSHQLADKTASAILLPSDGNAFVTSIASVVGARIIILSHLLNRRLPCDDLPRFSTVSTDSRIHFSFVHTDSPTRWHTDSAVHLSCIWRSAEHLPAVLPRTATRQKRLHHAWYLQNRP